MRIKTALISAITSFADDTLIRSVDGALGTRLLKVSSISKNRHSDLFTASSGIMHAAIDLCDVNTFAVHRPDSNDNTDNNLWRQEITGTLITTCPAYLMSALFCCRGDQRRLGYRSGAVPPRKIFITAHLDNENRTG